MKKKFTSLFLVFCMIVVFLPTPVRAAVTTAVCGDLTVTGDPDTYSYNSEDRTLNILKDGNFTISGTTKEDKIYVYASFDGNITLDNCHIDRSNCNPGGNAFRIADSSFGDMIITLVGDNSLKSGTGCAGLQKNGAYGSLTIQGSGSLLAEGGYDGAGIGGGKGQPGTNITINSGTITAVGGSYAAGIGGGGSYYGTGENITITGGTITAAATWGGAAIGGGYGGSGKSITISGGTVTATTDHQGGAGIGSGAKNNYGGGTATDITITGENTVVIASTASTKAAAIGNGSNATGDASGINLSEGLIFENGVGKIHGSQVTLQQDLTIEDGQLLIVEPGKTLVIPSTVELTNNGTIVNFGTIDGTVAGNQPQGALTEAPTANSLTYTGSPQYLVDAGSVTQGIGAILKYSLDDSSFSSERPIGTNAGKYTVYYKVETENYGSTDTKSIPVTIDPKSLSGVTVDAISDQAYTGSPITPAVTVKDGAKILTESSDYTAAYSNNVNVGTAAVTITGKGNYKGERSANFIIHSAGQSSPGVVIDYAAETLNTTAAMEYSTDDGGSWTACTQDMAAAAFGWNGSASETVMIRLAAKDNYDAGEAQSVTIPARPAAPDVTAADETVDGRSDGKIEGVSTAMEYRASTEIAWTDCTGSTVTGLAPGVYHVRCKSASSAFYSQQAVVTIGKGADRTYTLHVTAPIFDAETYGYAQPAAKAITIQNTGNSDAAVSGVTVGDTDKFIISGSGSSVTAGGSITSWTVQPKPGLEAGTYTATITITYNDNATAETQVSFTVNRTLPAVTAPAAKTDLVYNGSEQPLVIEGASSGGTLQYSLNGTDYSAQIPVAAGAGNYTVHYKVTGDRNYADVAAATIRAEIAPKAIAGAAVTLGGSLTYTGEEQAQTVDSVRIDGLDATYTVSDHRQTDAGIYTLTVTGTGNFSGTETKQFTIAKAGNGISDFVCADIVHGETPQPSAHSAFGTPVFTYSREEQGAFGPWNDENHTGTWYVRASVAETDNYAGTEQTISFEEMPEREQMPQAEIDYRTETLVKLTANAAYTILCGESEAEDATADENGVTPLNEIWIGQSLSIVRKTESGDYTDSQPQNLSIPARPAAPAEIFVTKTKEEITVTSCAVDCEFSIDGGAWQEGFLFTGLTAGQEYTVSVRQKATDSAFASFSRSRTVITVNADGSTVLKPGEGIQTDDGGIITNDDGKIIVTTGEGVTVTVTLPEPEGGAEIDEKGNLILPGGAVVVIGGEAIAIPEPGGVLTPDGKVVYTVTFDSQGGSSVEGQRIIRGGKAEKPGDPENAGHSFGGWYQEAECKNRWDFDSDTVTRSITLYAKWNKKHSGGGTKSSEEWENPFTDVREEDWFYSCVKYSVENNLFSGTSDTTFSPNQNMTRGMLATVLYRLAKEPETAAANLFYDVAEGKYYTKAIAWAAEHGIVSGYGSGKFGPEDAVTREQLATILWKYTGSPAGSGSLDGFADKGKVSAYAVPALQWAVEQKIVSGKGGGILDPTGKATRAEVAAMLMQYRRSQ